MDGTADDDDHRPRRGSTAPDREAPMMTPEQFEASALGWALGFLSAAFLIILYLRWEWVSSRPSREERAWLTGDTLIDQIGDLPDPDRVARTRQEWHTQRR